MIEHMKQLPESTPNRGEPIPEHFFRLIADCTYDWESWHSASGELLWVNQAVKRFTGYTPDECLKMDDYPLRLLAPEDRERIGRSFGEAAEGSTENNVEFRVLHRDGSQCWCASSWQPMLMLPVAHSAFA